MVSMKIRLQLYKTDCIHLHLCYFCHHILQLEQLQLHLHIEECKCTSTEGQESHGNLSHKCMIENHYHKNNEFRECRQYKFQFNLTKLLSSYNRDKSCKFQKSFDKLTCIGRIFLKIQDHKVLYIQYRLLLVYIISNARLLSDMVDIMILSKFQMNQTYQPCNDY